MAITATITRKSVEGDHRTHYGYLTLSGNYTAGGEPLTAGLVGLASLEMFDIPSLILDNATTLLARVSLTAANKPSAVLLQTALGTPKADGAAYSGTAIVPFVAIGY